MTSRSLLRLAFLSLLATLFAASHPALADSSHARIIRLSVIQGDVRFARDVKGDPLASDNVTWETAEPNLPIRQGYVLATDKDGRAAVEFENGAMAFLSENSVLEFYDLSLDSGAKSTRLVLRQGTASFYVNPGNGDYFSVTGGDFTVEANAHTTFRLDNFDDGSVVNVSKGHVSVLRKNKTSEVFKGQTLSARAGDENSVSIGSLPPSDGFDRWVSGRIDSVTAATASAQQYVNSPYYTAGLADLYTYGSWYPVAGYGNCWRPYGVGLGWSPFIGGGWFYDASFGPSFIGGAPWGWLPYHYGGWIFDPLLGWLWLPGGFGGYRYIPYRPVTGVFVRSKPGLLGIVPVHPLDAHGKTPLNLARGVFPVTNGSVASSLVAVAAGERWKTIKSVPRDTLASTVGVSAAPQRTSRTVIANNSGARVVTLDRNSSIAYDPREHRFVNTNAAAPSSQIGSSAAAHVSVTGQTNLAATQNGVATTRVPTGVPAQRTSVSPAPVRTSVYVPRAVAPPPSRSADYSRGGSSSGGGGARFDSSSRSSSASSAASSSRSSAPSAPSGGGRPH
jgi:FecR protein